MKMISKKKENNTCNIRTMFRKNYSLMYRLLVMFFSFCLSWHFSVIYTQSSVRQTIHIIARPLQDSVLLRWAPANYATWELGNQFGYMIERYTIFRDTILVNPPVKKLLVLQPIKPLELNEWERFVKSVKYAAIAAQALYGKSFETYAGEGFTPRQVYDKASEQQQRHAFALYAADMSPAVAKACGLWFTDNTALKNEKYLYRVYLQLPDSLKAYRDTAFVFTGTSDFTPLPAPQEFSAEFGDMIAILKWNAFVHDNIYTAYLIERSSDGGRSYEPITTDPHVPVVSDAHNEYAYKYDSLPKNNIEYCYRIRGINAFGEYGPWSQIVKGKGIDAILHIPNIKGYKVLKGYVVLDWDFPKESEKNITGFKILRSGNHKDGFTEIAGNVKPAERSYIDKKPLNTSYYKVVAYRDNLAHKQSFPYLVQLTDSIPPARPSGLIALADTSGIIRLSWQRNKEEDLFGYRVFRSASGRDEYSQRTSSPVTDTFYIDTISKKDLNTSVFYKIVAIDQRQNQSTFSNILEVVKPDIIPPSPPVIKETRATSEGIILEWINSSGSDVTRHEVYRKYEGDTMWVKLAEIPLKKGVLQGTFTDPDASPSVACCYHIIAADRAGNLSAPAQSVMLKGLNNRLKEGIKKIEKTIDYTDGKLELSWQLPPGNIKHIKIYRKTGTEPYALHKTLEGTATRFEDNELKMDEIYAYRVKLVYNDGSVSGFSEEVKIKY
jgi:fibronectin type 3 domain-containing protein